MKSKSNIKKIFYLAFQNDNYLCTYPMKYAYAYYLHVKDDQQ